MLSQRHRVRGLLVRHLATTEPESDLEIPKLLAALHLIADRDPIRFARLSRDLRGVAIAGASGNLAQYHHSVRCCVLSHDYLRDETTTPSDVAATIVHEATHARLMLAGFGYEPAIRERIEHICFKAEIAFAERLPDASEIVSRVERQLARDPSIWTDAERRKRTVAWMRQLGAPEWLTRHLDKARTITGA